MLKLSVAMEEWLRIGDNIDIIFLDVVERQVRVLVDAPREIPICRGKALRKSAGEEAYRNERRNVDRAIRGEDAQGGQVELSFWIRDLERRDASYGIYGKGKLARECYNVILAGGTQQILAYVNPQRTKYDQNVPVQGEEALADPAIDYIVVAIPDLKSYRGIANRLRDMGIPKEKLVWIPKV